MSVDFTQSRFRLQRLEARELLGREAVSLKIRDAPVGIAKIRPRGGRVSVGLDRLILPPNGLEGVRDRQMHVGIRAGALQKFSVKTHRLFVLPQTHGGGGLKS